MASLEHVSLCDTREYIDNRENRLEAVNIEVDELYMILCRLATMSNGKGAAKAPVRCEDIDRSESGMSVVRFTVLNDDLAADYTTETELTANHYMDPDMRVADISVVQAYFAGYTDDLDSALKAMLANNALASA